MAYQGAVGWVEVEADDVADFVAEPRDTAQHEGLGARQMRSLEGAFRSRQAQSGQIREWKQFDGGDFQIRAMGSVAYKLALVEH
jgi:hypothetical protein